jgi:hypothetical protein
MNRPDPGSRNRIHGIYCIFVAITGAAAACAPGEDPADAQSPAGLPSPGQIEVTEPLQLAERARVPENEPGFLSAELLERGLVIAHDGRLPAFEVGDVLGGTAGGGYLARVVAVRAAEAGRFVLDTEPAHLTELIREGEIHIRYDALDYVRRLDEAVLAARDRGDDDGEEIGRSVEALKVGGAAFIDLLDLPAAALPASCGVGIGGSADLDVTATLSPSIDLDLKIGAKGGGNPAPELKRFRLVASGMLQVDATLHATGTLAGRCSVDLLALAGGGAHVPLPALTFWVGPVPVIVTTEVVPVAGARIDLALEAAEVTAEAHALAGLAAGVVYEDAKWDTVWDPSASGNGAASMDAPGSIVAAGEVRAGAELRARLYGILGPTIGIEAFARATVETEPPYCRYEGWIDGGVRAYAAAEAGISVGPLDLTLARLPLVDLPLVSFETRDLAVDNRQVCER